MWIGDTSRRLINWLLQAPYESYDNPRFFGVDKLPDASDEQREQQQPDQQRQEAQHRSHVRPEGENVWRDP